MKYPKIETKWINPQDHITILVTFEPGEPTHEFCGVTYCRGECGFPAAVLPKCPGDCVERKMRSSVVACGALMGSFPWFPNDEWTGKKFVIPERYRESFMQKMWL